MTVIIILFLCDQFVSYRVQQSLINVLDAVEEGRALRTYKSKDKINKGEHRSKKEVPTTLYNRKHLKAWAKIPIPKQIEDEHIENKISQENKRENYWGTVQVGTL